MARPSEFSPETANAICERLALGESLRSICADDDMPGQTTVFRWLEQLDEFREQYAHAREMQAETHADEIVDIADKATDAQIARLQIDARRWKASKLAPKKYGEAVQMKHTDNDGGPVQQVMRWANSTEEATPDPSKS